MTYRLKDFGSYTAGGRQVHVTQGEPQMVQFTRSAAYKMDPRGHFAIEHAYVQYFIPEPRNSAAPVVLVHGGGMSGSCWETTPDGRAGWLHLLLDRGYEVHVVDNVERGRAGFAPDHWDGAPLLRSLQEAWQLFRIGHKQGFETRSAFDGQRFPVAHFDTFARSFVPRWLGTTQLQTAALLAVLAKTGPAKVICHSQGGEVVFDAHNSAPDLFDSIIALEPSALPNGAAALGDTPLVLCVGDFLDVEDHWITRRQAWCDLVKAGRDLRLVGPETFGSGNSHMLMMDDNSKTVLDAVLG